MGAPKWPPNPRRSSPPAKPWAPRYRLERETGFEPATPSLEGWRSTAELFPPERGTPCPCLKCGATCTFLKLRTARASRRRDATRPTASRASRRRAFLSPPSVRAGLKAPVTMVGRGGFEPPKAYASRFTVCPLCPLEYLPESAGRTWY